MQIKYAIRRIAELLLTLSLATGSPQVTGATPVDNTSPQTHFEFLEPVAEAFYRKHDLAGLSIAIGTASGARAATYHGYANLELDAPVSAQSLFRTASVSKWFTAIAALQLADTGILDLDAPVQEYCPEFPRKRWSISTRQLLTHTAGVRHYITLNGESPETEAERRELERRDNEELQFATVYFDNTIEALQPFMHDPLLFEPGSQQHYTSPGYRVIGCAIRGATGQSYNDAMQARVFHAADMPRTTTDDTTELRYGRVSGYRHTADGETIPAQYSDLSGNVPAGGHLSTTMDMINFGLHLLDEQFLPQGSRALMRSRPNFAALDEADKRIQVGPASHSYYAYGVMVVRQNAEELWYHTGAQSGARSLLAVLPSSSMALAILSNDEAITREQLTRLATQLIESATGKRFDLQPD